MKSDMLKLQRFNKDLQVTMHACMHVAYLSMHFL